MDYRPAGFHNVTPYLIVNGARKLMDFMKQAFEAQELSCYQLPGDERVMHAQMQIGDSVIELSDGNDQWKPMQFALHVYFEDVDAAHKRAVDAGARSLRPPTDEFYGDRSCEVVDPLGGFWFLATRKEAVSDEEILRRMASRK